MNVYEDMEGLKFKIGPESLYQTSCEQVYNLYKLAREFVQLSETDMVYDLYTVTVTIANFVERSVSKVVGME